MGTPASMLDVIANPQYYSARADTERANAELTQSQAAVAPAMAQQNLARGAEQLTAEQLANQERQRQIRDLDILGQAYQKTDGNPDSIRKFISQAGISGEGRVAFEAQHLKLLQERLNATKAQNEIRKSAEDEVGNSIDAYNGIKDPTEQQAAYAKDLDYNRARLSATGSTIQLPDQVTPEALSLLSGQLGHAGKVTDIALKHQQGEEAAQKAEEAKASAALKTAEAPGAEAKSKIEQAQASAMENLKPGDIEAQVSAAIDPQKYPGEYRRTVAQAKSAIASGLGMSAVQAAVKDGADRIGRLESAVAQAKATMPIKIETAQAVQGAGANAAAAGGGLDLMAEQALNGTFTSRNPILMAKVYNRASQLAKERGLTNQQVLMQRNEAAANKTALTAVTKQYETLKPFADMAEKNANVLEQKAALVDSLGAPFLNTPLRELEQKFAGNKDVAAFKAALLPVQADFARILSSQTGAGILTDESKREMQGAIGAGATPGQIKAALDVFHTDARNRKAAYEARLADLQGKTVVGNAERKPAADPTQAPATGIPAGAHVKYSPSTKLHYYSTDGDKTWHTAP